MRQDRFQRRKISGCCSRSNQCSERKWRRRYTQGTPRLNTRKLQNFVALEDALPAGIEVVNPNLALVGKFFQLPPADPQDRLLGLSYSEMRDRSTLLYFDIVDPGSSTYSVLARATAAGTFRWPAT